ncbi:hypothetical protein [Gordonia sp. (in: high G+C Gram-positive bacteria)]|uniref:hypothetical protein n=1 Tax=Gordonia sp. (in: high G+C Gram-positive bacteria) TaxID=84139 RepID=UPI002579E6BB|nr:hypothetical protein [Gordonia sp. (in: high G+C Gram-positive bacteria)]
MSDNKSVFPTREPAPMPRRTVWIITAIVVVVVVTATILVIVLNRGESTPTDHTPPSTTASAVPSTSTAFDGSGFTGTTVDKLNNPVQLPANPAGQLLPQTARTPADRNAAPAGLIWEKLYDLPVVPFSTSDGPTEITDGVAQGWTRTPQGAALAGISILSMWLTAPDGPSQTVQRTLLSGESELIATRSAESRPARVAMLNNPDLAPGALAGVQVTSFDPTFATIEYGGGPLADDSHPEGSYAVSTLSLTWTNGTWKLIVTPTTPDRGERRTTIAGMTSWTD